MEKITHPHSFYIFYVDHTFTFNQNSGLFGLIVFNNHINVKPKITKQKLFLLLIAQQQSI